MEVAVLMADPYSTRAPLTALHYLQRGVRLIETQQESLFASAKKFLEIYKLCVIKTGPIF